MILVLQNAFRPGMRDINLNTNYLLTFGNFRDRSMITTLARQILPGETRFLQDCYNRVVDSGAHAYLFLNLHTADRVRYWVRNGLAPDLLENFELYLPD